MADLPILFSAPMVRALIREIEQPGTGKTQTRRIIKPQGTRVWEEQSPSGLVVWMTNVRHEFGPTQMVGPRFRPGDRLWVREAWRTLHKWDDLAPRHLADDISKITYEADPERRNPLWCFGKLRPGMFMPRWASRLTLYVTDVRVQRLQDISEADAWSEGCMRGHADDIGGHFPAEEPDPSGIGWRGWDDARDWYADLWDNINGPGAWDANPWVSVTTFAVRLGNIDSLPATLQEAA